MIEIINRILAFVTCASSIRTTEREKRNDERRPRPTGPAGEPAQKVKKFRSVGGE